MEVIMFIFLDEHGDEFMRTGVIASTILPTVDGKKKPASDFLVGEHFQLPDGTWRVIDEIPGD